MTKLRAKAGQVVQVKDHAALDETGLPKVRPNCVVRLVAHQYVVVYVPRYNAEVFFDRDTYRSNNGRLEVLP